MLAGKTRRQKACQFYGQEHPRARGENWVARSTPWRQNGTSPRTRGKHWYRPRWRRVDRNIPAHAGKTPRTISCVIWVTEHPRARGENQSTVRNPTTQRGTSPRTRGKPMQPPSTCGSNRNIPAHAGKTRLRPLVLRIRTEHPRARGENCNVEALTPLP